MNFSPPYVCAGEGGGGEWELAEEWSAHQKVQVRGFLQGNVANPSPSVAQFPVTYVCSLFFGGKVRQFFHMGIIWTRAPLWNYVKISRNMQ
jgi:hypothetical protein